MASIIDKTYFFTGLEVAQISSTEVQNKVQGYIDRFEPVILKGLLGYELYKSFEAGRIADPIPPRIADILNGKEYVGLDEHTHEWDGIKFTQGSVKKSLLANYVYYNIVNENYSYNSASGEKKADTQNSTETSPKQRLFRVWNEMTEWNWELVSFLETFPDIYPEFVYHNGCKKLENFLTRANHVF